MTERDFFGIFKESCFLWQNIYKYSSGFDDSQLLFTGDRKMEMDRYQTVVVKKKRNSMVRCFGE